MAGISFWLTQIPGWLLFFYLIYAQCIPAFSYELGVRMKTQETAEQITPVGVAFFYGFAVADLIFYTPVLGLGLIGHALGESWASLVLGAALGITAYWPIVCLVAARKAHGARGWDLPNERQFLIVLPLVSLWALAAGLLLWVSG